MGGVIVGYRLRFCYSFSDDRFSCLLDNFRRNFGKLEIFTIDLSRVRDFGNWKNLHYLWRERG